MKYTIENLKSDVVELLSLCKNELANLKKGLEGQGNIEQFETYIIPQFEELLKYADQSGFDFQKFRESFAAPYFVVDSWDYHAEISLKIMDLNANLKKLR